MAKVSDAHLEARRRSILTAAAHCFSTKGVEAATMAEIAKLAGISPGAIYRYFDSKEALARGCLSENSSLVASRWKQEQPAGRDAWSDFRELARTTFSLIDEPETRNDTILYLEGVLTAVRDDNEVSVEALRAEHETVAAGIEHRLREASRQGTVSPGVDLRELAQALMSFYWGVRINHLIDPAVEPLAQLEQIITVLEKASGRTP